MKKSILRLAAAAVLFLLLSHPALSIEGAKSGLLLWFNTVLPTLLPFMLCSGAIVSLGAVPTLIRPLKPLFWLFSLSENGSYALFSGLLCGYPMGPKTAADFLRRQDISLAEAKYLLAISAWPSPMFLSGYLRSFLEPEVSFPLILLCVYLPLFPLAAAAKRVYRIRRKPGARRNRKALGACCPSDVSPSFLQVLSPDAPSARPPFAERKPSALAAPVSPSGPLSAGQEPESFDALLMDSLEIMAKIGGYIMIFSILAAFVNYISPPGFLFRPFLLGAVEMTTGIREIAASQSGLPAAAGLMGAAVFGGLSGVFQVSAVISHASAGSVPPPKQPSASCQKPASHPASPRRSSPSSRSGHAGGLSIRSGNTRNAGLSIRHYVLWKLLHLGLSTALFILLSFPD